jgi:hypothetical protein
MTTASRISEITTRMSGMALGGRVQLLRLLVGLRDGQLRAAFAVHALYASLQSHRLPRLFPLPSQQ